MSQTSPIEPTPGKGSTPPPQAPLQPVTPAQAPAPQSILDSPFARMFAQAGAPLTAKQLTEIINNLLRQQITEIKKSDESWKRAMKKIKEAFENDS